MTQISAVIITKNEAKNIERCILSLQNVADEILVLDNGSTDKTIEIAKNLGARVEVTKWQGYSKTKNYGSLLASNNYILSIDADEALSDELKNHIISIKTSLRIDHAYKFNRLTNYCGKWIKHCGWYPDTKMRLWSKEAGKWQGEIHEEVKLEPFVKHFHLKGDLLHYSYYNIEEHFKQADKFTTLTAKDAFEKGKKASVLKLVFAPVVKFTKAYFFQLGFLDGTMGFQVCRVSALATFWKYKKLRQLHNS
jgi:glycosyltransferase involved in cell wall biosynthesis